MPDPFIDAQDIVDILGRGTITDPGMLIAIDSACDTCRTIAEQDFNFGTATVALDGTGSDALVLAHFPAISAGTVTVNGGTITDYMLTANGLLLRGTAGGGVRPTWPQGRQNVTVTYEHGYLAADLPRDVRKVALDSAIRSVVQGVAKRETQGDVSIDYAVSASDLTPNELRILKKKRRTRSF